MLADDFTIPNRSLNETALINYTILHPNHEIGRFVRGRNMKKKIDRYSAGCLNLKIFRLIKQDNTLTSH